MSFSTYIPDLRNFAVRIVAYNSASLPIEAIYNCGFSSKFKSGLFFVNISINLSTPVANPTAGVDTPPNSSTKPSYLPPPRTVNPSIFETNSKTVFV